MRKLERICNKVNNLNREAIEVITNYVEKHGGCIRTDDYSRDTIYGYVYNDCSERMEEVYILAVFVQSGELFIQVSYGQTFLEDEFVPNIEDDDAHSVYGDTIMLNATLHNICSFIEEYVDD